MTIAVIGASGRLGKLLAQRLIARGEDVIAIGRSAENLSEFPTARIVDATDIAALRAALAGADKIVSCIHARYASNILAALPDTIERIILTGSTRRFTKFPDHAADEVRTAEAALAQSGRPGVILHPTMIYGADGENNVRRVASYIKRFGIIPLPRGGKTLLQPIHTRDVVACLEAALFRDTAPGAPIVIAGPAPITYRAFVETIAAATDRKVLVIAVPVLLLKAVGLLTRLIPGLPAIRSAEIQRLLEDKNFDTSEMRTRLGVVPIEIIEGLNLTFNRLQRMNNKS